MDGGILKNIEALKAKGAAPGASVKETMKETGKKAVGCFPIYAPEEIIYAAGAVPVGMWGGRKIGNLADKYLQSFCCSIMKANTQQCLCGDYDMLSAALITAYCDTLKCVMENWKTFQIPFPIIPAVYPQNRKSDGGKIFFQEEMLRIKGKLEKILQVEVSERDMENAWEAYEDYRKTMIEFTKVIVNFPKTFDPVTRHLALKAAWFMDKAIYTQQICGILQGLKQEKPETGEFKRVILTGLLAEPAQMLQLLSENNLQVAADDLAQESRQFRSIVTAEGSVFQKMAERNAQQDGCTFLYDKEKSRGRRLIHMAKKYEAAAVIFCQLKFCDPDEFDYPMIKKELEAAGIPLLHLEFEQQMDSVEGLRTRVQSFAEMLD